VETYSICPFVTGPHSKGPQSPSIQQHIAGFPSFKRLHNFPLFIYPIFLVHSSINGLLGCFNLIWWWWMMLQGTWACTYFFEILFSVLLSKYTEVGLLYHILVPFVMFWGAFILFIFIFIRIAQGHSLWQLQIDLHCTLVSLHHHLPLPPWPT
jgi:hypothetical protein